jgi:hypothetical protein
MEMNIDLHAYNNMGKYKLHLGMCFFINVTIIFLLQFLDLKQINEKKIPKYHSLCFLKILINACK